MLPSQKTAFYRFNPQPPPFLPLSVRSVGEYDIAAEQEVDPPFHKSFIQIFWSESGSGEFHVAKRRVKVRENEIFFSCPGSFTTSTPRDALEIPLAHPRPSESRQLDRRHGVANPPAPARRCPIEIFRSLQQTVRLGTVAADRQAAHLAHALLLAAMEGSLPAFDERRPTWVEQCRARIDADYADSQLERHRHRPQHARASRHAFPRLRRHLRDDAVALPAKPPRAPRHGTAQGNGRFHQGSGRQRGPERRELPRPTARQNRRPVAPPIP